MAKEIYVNQTAISQWERGVTNPSTQTAEMLADYFHVTVDYLLGRDVPDTDVGDKQAKKEPAADDSGLDAYRKKLIETFASASPEDIRRILEIARLVMGNREV